MRDVDALIAAADHALNGDAWYGPSVTLLLEDVDAAAAQALPAGANHSIWQLVKHMAFWARYVPYRIEGGSDYASTGENWREQQSLDDAQWAAAVEDLQSAHGDFVRALRACDDALLDEVTSGMPTDDKGEPITLRRVAEGVTQHYAYHAGQIACVKNALGAGA